MKESFEEVLSQFEPLIKKLIKKFSYLDRYDELFQIGRIALWEAYVRFDDKKGPFPAYARTYVTGRFLQHTKKSQTNVQEVMDAEVANYVVYDVPFLDSYIVEEYLQTLSARERLFVVYVFLQQGSQRELAKREGVSYETVRSWQKCALKKLRIKGRAMNKI